MLALASGVVEAQDLQTLRQHAQDSATRDMSGWVRFPPAAAQPLAERKNAPTPAPASESLPSGWVQFPFKRIVPPAHDTLPLKKEVPAVAGQGPATLLIYEDGTSYLQSKPSSADASTASTASSPATPITPADPVAPVTTAEPTVSAAPAAPEPARPAPVPVIQRFSVTGSTVFTPGELQTMLHPWVGQPLLREQLEAAAQALSTAYRDGGWVARVTLPDQDVTEGDITLQVTEAKLAQTIVDAPVFTRAPLELIQSMVEHRAPKERPLNIQALDEANTLINEIPGITASMSLKPGDNAGETQAVIQVESSRSVSVSVTADNAGSRATGRERVMPTVQAKGLLGRGDLQTLQALESQGLQSLRWSYSEPVGRSGLRVGPYLSQSRYHLVLPEFNAINARGPSSVMGLEFMLPWVRHAQGSLNAQMNIEQKRFRNEAADVQVSRYKTNLVSAGLSGQLLDGIAGGGINTANVQSTWGRLDLSGSANQAADAQTAQTEGSFHKLRWQFMRQQKTIGNDSLLVGVQAQWTNKNLDSSEKFFLGGPQGVRAYPVNEAGGSLGRLFSVEWQHPFITEGHQRYTLSAFSDVGQVQVNKQNLFAGAPNLNDYSLRGYGLWLGTQIPWSQGETQLRLTWSRRVGSNPNGFTAVLDQDGSLVVNRLWLSAQHQF